MSSQYKRPAGVVIVGGGLAGQRCAEALRRLEYYGPIRIVCAEDRRPYDRPPLSKELLAGSRGEESLAYRSLSWYAEHAIELMVGARATGIRPRERQLLLSSQTTLPYEALLVATGSRPRTLPILEGFENVSTLRTIADARRLREVLAHRPRLTVIGAGFIGQEVAATARALRAEVTMVEAAELPLMSILGPEMGRWFAQLHRDEGVDLLTGCTVERAYGNGHVRELQLSNGRRIATDHVVVGIGVQPDTGWLAGSGIGGLGGIDVDAVGRTSAPFVFAAGDAARIYNPVLGRRVPGSHWEAAARQGAQAARAMLDLDPDRTSLTSFWTDQYGVRIQYLGHAEVSDAVRISGDPSSRDFSAIFLRAGRPVAGLLVNRPRSLPATRNLIEEELHELSSGH